jgi:phosphoglycerate dehydrogenase-like enzyme
MSEKHRTLFVTQRGWQQQQWALEGAPPELDIVMRRDPSKAEIISLLPEMEFFISERTGVIDADMIASGCNLRLIQRLGVQTWDIDLAAAERAHIPVCYLPVATCQLVAEHVMMQTLGLTKRVRELMKISEDGGDWGQPPRRCDEDTFAYNWSRRQNIGGLMGKTVGILGFGEIGVELAWRLKAFDCSVMYNKRKRLPAEVETQFNLCYAASAMEIARACDVVVALMPFGPDTEQSMGAEFFAAMPQGALFVQTGGSGTVDELALAQALSSGHLGGAAVDGFTWEPVQPENPLLALARDPMCNLILTPHVAAGAISAIGAIRAGDYVNILAALHGAELHYRLV